MEPPTIAAQGRLRNPASRAVTWAARGRRVGRAPGERRARSGACLLFRSLGRLGLGRFVFAGLLVGLTGLGACSLINAPVDVLPGGGGGGAGGGGATATSAATSTSASGSTGGATTTSSTGTGGTGGGPCTNG